MKQFIISVCCLLTTTLSALARELPSFRINVTGGYSYFLGFIP